MKCTRFGKGITLLLCIVLMAVSALSFAFILENDRHDCIGEGCHTCAQIEFAVSVLHLFGSGLPIAAPLFISALFSRAVFAAASSGLNRISLVSLKVKLSN